MRIYISEGRRGLRFTPAEKKDLVITWGVLSIAFFIAWRGYAWSEPMGDLSPLFWLGLSAAAVFTGVILHEIGHKYASLRSGIWAEYRRWDMGLIIAFFTSFLGFMFAAPGAVHIMGMGTRRDMEEIAKSGVRINMALAAILLVGFLLTVKSAPAAGLALWFVARVNSYLALFNLLPIPPLDGYQLLHLNFRKYLLHLIVAGVLFATVAAII